MPSLISILLPSFKLSTSDIEEVKSHCVQQFETTSENLDIFEIRNQENFIHFGLIFKESSLSLNSIEDLIYQRNCMQSLSEKAFESLQLMSKKLTDLESQLKSYYENGSNEELQKDLINDNLKLKELLSSQIEFSDNFRTNTAKTFNKIKDEFKTMVCELEALRKKTTNTKGLVGNVDFLRGSVINIANNTTNNYNGIIGRQNITTGVSLNKNNDEIINEVNNNNNNNDKTQ